MEIVISESLGTIQQNGGWHCARRPPRLINKRDSVVTVINAQCRQSNPQEMTMKLTLPGRTRDQERWRRARRRPRRINERDAVVAVVNAQRRQSNPQEMRTTLTPPGRTRETSRMMASREEPPPHASTSAKLSSLSLPPSTPPVKPPGDNDKNISPRPNKG